MIIRLITPTNRLKLDIDENLSLENIVLAKTGQKQFQASIDAAFKTFLENKKTISELGIEKGCFIYVRFPESVYKNSLNDARNNTREKLIKRDITKYCNHSQNAMCSNCAPLDPWDSRYHAENKIKYISYESYTEMLKKENVIYEPLSYKKVVCTTHNANMSCNKCQINSIALMPQIYRMIDHIEFTSSRIMENFISACKNSQRQRFGFLIGREVDYDHVPLGKKAMVSWIYEPKQENFPDGFVIDEAELEEILQIYNESRIEDHKEEFHTLNLKRIYTDTCDERQDDFFQDDIIELSPKTKEVYTKSTTEALRNICERSNLRIVGIIYADFTNSRNHIVSGLEIDFIARLQLKTLYNCKETKTRCNSKLVTVICKKDGSSYTSSEFAVSEQCMELIKNNLIYPTEDPEQMKKHKDAPEIFYRGKNEFDTVVKHIADPLLPVEYFLVSLTHGHKENPMFYSVKYFDKNYTDKKMAKYFENKYTLENFSNFDFLVKADRDGYFPTQMENLVNAIVTNNTDAFEKFLKTAEFRKFKACMDPYDVTDWPCQACTYMNSGSRQSCEICENPK